ncbi:MAG TPA: hypothetical protein VM165_16405 [Planctomycetaceae bacterium]|nr:hypothetical protein [Planctomycetaceae bacterium]
MNLAGQAAAQDHMGRVLELLESQRPRLDEEDLRNFEWYHLWQVCFRGQRHVTSRTDSSSVELDPLFATAVSPNGRLLVAGTGSGRLCWWALPAMDDAAEMPSNLNSIWSLAFSPNGRTLAAAGQNGSVKLWDVETRREMKTLAASIPGGARSVSFSPDGTLLLVTYWEGSDTVRIWDVAAGVEHAVLKTPAGSYSAAFSPDGTSLAASDTSGNFRIWAWDGTRAQERALGCDGPEMLGVQVAQPSQARTGKVAHSRAAVNPFVAIRLRSNS